MKARRTDSGDCSVSSDSSEKSVQFKMSCRVRTFPMVGEADRELLWYHKKDYREFKRERKAAAQLAKAVGPIEVEQTDFVSCRGIEYMINEAHHETKAKLQRQACVAVLSAQLMEFHIADEMEKEPNMIQSRAIPAAYEKYSKLAHSEASQKAWAWRQSDHGVVMNKKDVSSMMDSSVRSIPSITSSSSPRMITISNMHVQRPCAA